MWTDIISALEPQLAGVSLAVGEESLGEEGRPPRITFIPMDSSFGLMQPRGGFDGPELGTRELATDLIAIEAHCWGAAPDLDGTGPTPTSFGVALAEYAAATAVRDQLVAALMTLRGNVRLEGSRWLARDGREVNDLGRVAVLRFVLESPIVPANPDFAELLITSVDASTAPSLDGLTQPLTVADPPP